MSSSILLGVGHESGKVPATGRQPESTGPSVFGYKHAPFHSPGALGMAWTHELLGTLNNFGEAKLLTLSPLHLRCCCDSQTLVTPTPTARRCGRGGVLPVTDNGSTMMLGGHLLRESAVEPEVPSSHVAMWQSASSVKAGDLPPP